MNKISMEEILKANELTEDDVTKCVEEVAKFDEQVEASYKAVGKVWSLMNLFSVKRILNLYDKSKVNIKTGEIMNFYRNKIHEFDMFEYNNAFVDNKPLNPVKASLLVQYKDSVKENYEAKMYIATRYTMGAYDLFDCKRPGKGFHFYRVGMSSISFQEVVDIDLVDLYNEDYYSVTIFMYAPEKTGPKMIFSSVNFSIIDSFGNEIIGADLCKEANSSYGALAFELVYRSNKWQLFYLGDAISLELEKFVSIC